MASATVRLEHDKHERLKAIAERERRSVGKTLALLVDRYLEEQELTA